MVFIRIFHCRNLIFVCQAIH